MKLRLLILIAQIGMANLTYADYLFRGSAVLLPLWPGAAAVSGLAWFLAMRGRRQAEQDYQRMLGTHLVVYAHNEASLPVLDMTFHDAYLAMRYGYTGQTEAELLFWEQSGIPWHLALRPGEGTTI
jgi:hypothetical protein